MSLKIRIIPVKMNSDEDYNLFAISFRRYALHVRRWALSVKR